MLDDRGDLEGWCFEGHDLRPHADKVAGELMRRKGPRLAALGYVVQPPEDVVQPPEDGMPADSGGHG